MKIYYFNRDLGHICSYLVWNRPHSKEKLFERSETADFSLMGGGLPVMPAAGLIVAVIVGPWAICYPCGKLICSSRWAVG